MSSFARALHFVLKVGNLKSNLEFFRDKLGMKVLRHEIFEKGCEAACNGPYQDMWSKTMIGYGPEDTHFVLELTYNYTIGNYKLGNDLNYIKLGLAKELFKRVKEASNEESEKCIELKSPDGYKFVVEELRDSNLQSDLTQVCLSTQNLEKSLDYWCRLLKMKCFDGGESSTEALLGYSDSQAKLKLVQISEPIDHKSAYGRIAFSCPSSQLKGIQKSVEDASQKVLTPYLSLDTPGKATVQVVILADPDGHEICFVGDEGFRELSQFDPNANHSIEESIAKDKSNEWFAKMNIKKQEG